MRIRDRVPHAPRFGARSETPAASRPTLAPNNRSPRAEQRTPELQWTRARSGVVLPRVTERQSWIELLSGGGFDSPPYSSEPTITLSRLPDHPNSVPFRTSHARIIQ